jgi:hypothetical protein
MEMVLDPGAFRAWLLAQSEGAVVGRAVRARWCPLACYLRARDSREYSVAGNCCTGEPGEVFLLPGWAEAFAVLVDVAHEDGAPVLREAALVALDRVLFGGE